MDRYPGGLVRVNAPLRGDGIGLARQGLSGVDVAVLEDGSCIAEDEVDRAIDFTVTVELTEGVGVEGVLVAHEFTAVEA